MLYGALFDDSLMVSGRDQGRHLDGGELQGCAVCGPPRIYDFDFFL